MGSFSLDKYEDKYQYILFFLSALLFPMAIGTVHLFDWDEVNFAEVAREMIVNDNYLNVQINYLPFWEKPPLFFWIQSAMMHIFGVNEFASRLPNAIIGIISIMCLYNIGSKIVSKKLGFIWGLAYLGSMLPHFYFKSGIIDPLFNLFIFLSIYYFYLYQQEYFKKNLIIASILAGLAVLTKGPVSVLIIFLVVVFFIVYKWKTIQLKALDIIISIIIICALTSVWFLSELINGGGMALFQEFFDYQVRLFTQSEAGHGQPFYYHFIVLFFGCFPISLIAVPYILKKNFKDFSNTKATDFYTLMFILFWVVLILFSLTTTKIVHYSSLCYFPLSFIAAYILYRNISSSTIINTVSYYLVFFIGVVLSVVFTALPLIIKFKEAIIPLIKDPFAVQNLLLPVKWGGYEFLIGIAYFILLLIVLPKVKKDSNYIAHLFVLNAVMLNLLMVFIVPKIEQHVQGCMIAFFEQHQKPTEYVTTYGFKSYAQFFYTNKQRPNNPNALNEQWLLHGEIDQPVFIVSKIQNKEKVSEEIQNVKFLYARGGFAFFERKPLK